MTDKATDVTQADRDAAAAVYLSFNKYGIAQGDAIKAGKCDWWPIVQTFARHRTASEQPASGEMERTTIARALHQKTCGLLPVSAAGPLEDEWSFWLSLADAALSTTSEALAQEDQQ